jgi:hypothetical protein
MTNIEDQYEDDNNDKDNQFHYYFDHRHDHHNHIHPEYQNFTHYSNLPYFFDNNHIDRNRNSIPVMENETTLFLDDDNNINKDTNTDQYYDYDYDDDDSIEDDSNDVHESEWFGCADFADGNSGSDDSKQNKCSV